jgi:phosphoribosylaminoimidazolecarboxamide formyltransferase/IMP cyclohydrolase
VASGTLASARQIHGKELSYNNLLDLDAALSIVREFADPACVVIKHTNPCGCAEGDTLAGAFADAYAGDPISAFGSIIGFNRPVDRETAELLCEPNRFIEAIIAPGFSSEAFELITSKPKWKANVRLLECPTLTEAYGETWEYRRVTGGMLVQHRDEGHDPESDWTIPTDRKPTEAEVGQLRFAWRVCKHVKSNAIVLCQEHSLVGVGAGQMSRVDSAFIAAHKAGERSQGAVVASDAFFPFRDGVDELARHGVKAIIQPGGSKGDPDVIASCNEHGLAMIFTGRRHFRH